VVVLLLLLLLLLLRKLFKPFPSHPFVVGEEG
jgi:hypothetical protein